MSEEKGKVTEAKIKVFKEIISFHNIKTGKETVERYCKVFVLIIVEKLKERIALFEDNKSFKAFRVFNVSKWSLYQDNDQMLNADIKNIEILSTSLEHVLQGKKYNLKEVKKEWKKLGRRKLSINKFQANIHFRYPRKASENTVL